VNTIIAVLLSAFAALIGAWAGARAAFDRYRSERSFDRQVDWYERAARAIGACIDTLDAALFLEKENRLDDADQYWPRMKEHLMQLAAVAAESDLYAGLSGHKALVEGIHQLNGIDRDSKVDAKTNVVAARTRMATRMLPVLRSARLVVANELRKQFGLEPLTELIGPGEDGAA
jgi:hypothetical protein